MKTKSTLRHFLLLAGSSLLAISSASAGPIDWDGGGANNNLSTGGNWVGDPSPVDVSSIFKFGGDTRNAPVNDYAVGTVLGSASANLFWFTNDGSAGRTNAFTLTGNQIKTNTGNGVIVTSAITTGPTITDTVDIDMILQGNLVLLPATGHDVILSGDISESGSRQFIKQGNGNITLSGNNSFSSTVSIFDGGTVNIDTLTNSGVNSSIGTNSTILFNKSTNATLNYTGAATSTNRFLTLGGNGNFANDGRFTNNGTGAVVFTNSFLNNASGVNIATSRTLFLGGTNTDANTIQGVIRDNTGDAVGKLVNLTKEDAGTWILSGANTYGGATTINGGILQFAKTNSMSATSAVAVNDTATLAVNAGGAGEFTNATSGNGSIGGLLAGNGGQSGSTVSYTGNVRLGIDTTNAGGGSLTYSGVIGNVGTSLGLTKRGTGTLTLSNANTFTGNTLVTDGKIALGNALALQNSAYDTDLSIAGGLDVTGYTTPTLGGLTGSVDLSNTLITGYSSVTNLKLNPQTGITQTYSGVISDGATGMDLTKSGGGTQILTANTSYTGATHVTEGTLKLNGAKLGGGTYTGAITLGAGATLEKNSGGMQILNGAITGSGSLVMSSGEMIINNSGNNFGSFTMTSAVGNGRVFLGNSGALTGATVTVDSGTFVFNGGASGTYDNAITVTSNNGPGNVGLSARASSGVTLNNVTLLPGSGFIHLNNDDALTKSIEITNNQTLGGDLVLAVGSFRTNNNAVGEVTLSGDIGGSGSLTMSSTGSVSTLAKFGGTGVLNLTGNNDYTGGTVLNSGNIALGATGTLGATTGSLQVNNDNTGATHRSVQLTLATGANTTTGSLSGTIATAASGTNTAAIQTQAGRTFTVNQTTDGTYGGTISGDGSFTVGSLSTAILTLSGNNTYTGATLVSAGTLFVTGSLVSDVTVSDTATVGGDGTVGNLSFSGGSFFDIFLPLTEAGSLTTTTISFDSIGFDIGSLVSQGAAVDWGTVDDGTYTLITGTLDSTNLGNFGLANAYDLGGGRSAYFQEGSLQLVIIPEPNAAALLGSLGMLLLLRRRRA